MPGELSDLAEQPVHTEKEDIPQFAITLDKPLIPAFLDCVEKFDLHNTVYNLNMLLSLTKRQGRPIPEGAEELSKIFDAAIPKESRDSSVHEEVNRAYRFVVAHDRRELSAITEAAQTYGGKMPGDPRIGVCVDSGNKINDYLNAVRRDETSGVIFVYDEDKLEPLTEEERNTDVNFAAGYGVKPRAGFDLKDTLVGTIELRNIDNKVTPDSAPETEKDKQRIFTVAIKPDLLSTFLACMKQFGMNNTLYYLDLMLDDARGRGLSLPEDSQKLAEIFRSELSKTSEGMNHQLDDSRSFRFVAVDQPEDLPEIVEKAKKYGGKIPGDPRVGVCVDRTDKVNEYTYQGIAINHTSGVIFVYDNDKLQPLTEKEIREDNTLNFVAGYGVKPIDGHELWEALVGIVELQNDDRDEL